jgi:hypothetical protein
MNEVVWMEVLNPCIALVAEKWTNHRVPCLSPDSAKDKKFKRHSITKLAEGARRHQAYGEAAG